MRIVQGSPPSPPPGDADHPPRIERAPNAPAPRRAPAPGPANHHTNGHLSSRTPAEAHSDDVAAVTAFERARAGERAAYGVVVRTYQDRLYNAVFRMVNDRDDAAEITQEAFTRGLEKLKDFRGESGPYTWLFRIAMNAAVSRIRRGGRRRTLSLEALASGEGGYATSYGRSVSELLSADTAGPGERLQMSEDHRAVADALRRLDAEYRALLVMRDLEGFDYRQMAEVLGLPLGTLKSRLFRARVALRELLQDHFSRRD